MIKTDMRREIGVVVHVGMNMSTFLFVSDPLAVRVLCCVARLAEPPLLVPSLSLPLLACCCSFFCFRFKIAKPR